MTRKTNARIAGISFLAYIAVGLTSMALSGRAKAGQGAAARLASMAEHAQLVKLDIILTLVCAAFALVLGVTLHALTRDEDPDIALIGLCSRAAEGIIAVIATAQSLLLFSIATAAPPMNSATEAIATMVFRMGGLSGTLAAICFTAGSTAFAYLFLRARTIPRWMAWLGVVASLLLLIALPLQLAKFLTGPFTQWMWLPMLVFELVFAGWLIVKGANPAEASQ